MPKDSSEVRVDGNTYPGENKRVHHYADVRAFLSPTRARVTMVLSDGSSRRFTDKRPRLPGGDRELMEEEKWCASLEADIHDMETNAASDGKGVVATVIVMQ